MLPKLLALSLSVKMSCRGTGRCVGPNKPEQHRLSPFTIRLKDRSVQESTLQPVTLKIDPGSKTTGLALARVEETGEGEVHHALHLADLSHRGEEIRDHLRTRAAYRRRRRSTNLRYRAPRFRNRRRAPG